MTAATTAATTPVSADAPLLATPRAAAIERDEPDHLVVRATAPAGGYLVLTDSFLPGWRARVDGREAQVERANSSMRAVSLPPGDHLVELRYEPPTLYVGAATSLIGWLAIAALAADGFRRRDARRAAQPPVPAGVPAPRRPAEDVRRPLPAAS